MTYQMSADAPGFQAGADQPAGPDAGPAVPRADEHKVKLTVLLGALDRAGLGDQLAECRALVAQADGIDRASLADHQQARREFGELVEQVKSGDVSTEDGARHLHGWQPWEPWNGIPARSGAEHPTPARLLAVRAVRELRRAAWQHATRDAWDVHKALARRADAAVKAAVKAGRALVDVPAVVAALPPARDRNAPANQAELQAAVRRPVRVPTLPTVSLDQIQGNPKLMQRWGEATEAARDFKAVREVADLVHQMVGGRSVVLPGDVDSDRLWLVESQLPEQVQLAVFDALGWRPGLHLSLKPAAPQPPAERSWVVPAPVKVGPYGTGHLGIQS